jgi:hypothetical protein
MSTIILSYEDLKGDYRTFESGKMDLFFVDDILVEVKVDLCYDNYDYWGTIKKHYKIGDTVRIYNNRMEDIGGVIESFEKKDTNIRVHLVHKSKTFFLIDCLKD